MRQVGYKNWIFWGIWIFFVLTNTALAGGFYVPQKGAVGVGLANAGGAARAEDGSTLFFNPAGMTELSDPLAQAGVDLIFSSVEIDSIGSTATTPGTLGAAAPYPGGNGDASALTPLPNIYLAYPVSETGFWLGLAVTAPFGLSVEYADDWFGRYDSIFSQLKTIDIAPSLAYRINNAWSVGAGLDIQYADAKLTSAIPDTLNPGGPTPETDGLSTLKGDDWSVGFNVGVLFKPMDTTRVGLHFRSGMDHDLGGTATIEGLQGPLSIGNGQFAATTPLNLPPFVSLAVAQDFGSAFTFYGEVQWFGWDTFNEIRISFDNGMPDVVRPQGFRNTFTVAGGLDYRLNSRWTLRAGLQYDQTPTVDEYRNTSIPDGDLIFAGLGASYRITDQFIVDAGYFHVFFSKENIDLTQSYFEQTPVTGSVDIRGRTDVSVNTLSINLRYLL